MTQAALIVLGLAIVVGVALVAAGRLGEMPEALPDSAPVELPGEGMTVEHLETLRLGVALRGYRMDEVDALLDRVTAAISERDARIAALEGHATSGMPLGSARESMATVEDEATEATPAATPEEARS